METVTTAGTTLRLDEATGQVIIRFAPSGSHPATNLPQLQQAVADQGFAQFWIDERALAEFEKNCGSASEPVESVIGERRDGSYQLEVSEDLMSIWLTVTLPMGGKPANPQVNEALQRQGIAYGLLPSLSSVLENGGERVLIAQGLYPVEGSATCFESLLPTVKERRPQVDEHGIADYRNLGQLVMVHPGDPLMRRIPAMPGKNGTNVKGQTIAAKPVLDSPFAPGLTGVAPASNDANLLLAEITGQPIQVSGGVIVNPVLEVPNVDLHSGNIEFEGTVRVLGDIRSGMRVKATADVIVGGMIEAAEVAAGGDVVASGGIVGRVQVKAGGEEAAQVAARVQAGGCVSARFAENAVIHADHALLVEDSALECDLSAHEQILIGKAGSKHGHLIGGNASAKKLIKAAVLGAPRGAITRLHVGQDPQLYKSLASNNANTARLQGELKGVLELVAQLKAKPEKVPEVVWGKVEHTRQKLVAQLQELGTEHARLAAQLKQLQLARIEVSREIYIGVEVQIGAKSWRAEDDCAGEHTLALADDQIVMA
jgi:hypothetical protein